MKTYRMLSPLQRISSLALAISAALLMLYGTRVVFSTATVQEEREVINEFPKHLPLKIKVKNLERVKKLDNENWLRDLVIEVENIGEKPIYHLLFSVSLKDVKTENNRNLGFPIRYGRAELTDFMAPLQPDDVPISPGKSYTFTIPEQLQRGWESFSKRRNVPKMEAKKFRLVFQHLNFGDGTGFSTVDGEPVDIHKKRVAGSCVENDKKGGIAVSGLNEPLENPPYLSLQVSALFLPANFLPVNFSLVNTPKTASNESLTRPDVCCPSSPCFHLRDATVTCCSMPINVADSAPCSDPRGGCRTYYTEDVPCNDAGGTICRQDFLLSCSGGPTPTPTPTPTPPPAPTPTPTCDPHTRPIYRCKYRLSFYRQPFCR